jgi:hypothetical protein
MLMGCGGVGVAVSLGVAEGEGVRLGDDVWVVVALSGVIEGAFALGGAGVRAV